MPQSIQVYKFETTKREGQVVDACKEQAARNGGRGGQYPRMLDVGRSRGNVTGLLHVRVDDEILHCRFALRPRDGRLVLAGESRARSLAAEFLARVLEDRPRARVVYKRHLDVRQMLLLFDGVTGQDGRNIISKLTLYFEPKFGRQYAQETYTLIAYSFVENRCASKHKDFKSLCKDAKAMELRLLINGCAGVAPEPDGFKRHAMVAKPDCSFRMYRDVPLDSWLGFCDALLGFLTEVDN